MNFNWRIDDRKKKINTIIMFYVQMYIAMRLADKIRTFANC